MYRSVFGSMACFGASNILYLGFFLVVGYHCARLPKLKALDNFKPNLTLNHSEPDWPWHGKFIILESSLQGSTDPKTLLESDTDYQADMGIFTKNGENFNPVGSNDAAVAQIQKLEPKVECTANSMRLNLQEPVQGVLLSVERGNHLSPLPLSKLPPSCGYTVKAMQRDLVLVAPNDGCFVAVEEDCYVLLLRLSDLPVKMSCPLMRPPVVNIATATCRHDDIEVNLKGGLHTSEIYVKLFGDWQPLESVAEMCGFNVNDDDETVIVIMPYNHCLKREEEKYIVEVKGAKGEATLLCSPPNQLNNPTHCQNWNGNTCQPELNPETLEDVYSQSPGALQDNLQVQQFPELALSQVYQQPVDSNTQTGFRLDLQSQLTLPLQPVKPVSQSPGAPVDSVQRNVLSGQLYQQQYLVDPNVSPGTVQHNRPADAPKPDEVDPLTLVKLFERVGPPLVNQPPPVPDVQQNNGGVAQEFANVQPVYCSQSCPSGSSNCCFQLAFHQHYHHIVPAGPGYAPIYTGLPALSPVAFPPVPPQSLPAGNEALGQPPEGSLDTRSDLPISTPFVADASLPHWLTVSQRPYQIHSSQYGQTPRNPGAQILKRFYRQNPAPPFNYRGPSEATRTQSLDRRRYSVNPDLSPSSPRQLYPAGPGQSSRAYIVQRGPPSQYQQVVQDVQRPEVQRVQLHEPVDLAYHHPEQRTISAPSLPEGF